MPVAIGSFDITPEPQPPFDTADGLTLGPMRFTKRFNGDLDATSIVYMTSVMTPVKGSAAYVALEKVTGTLHGRHGSFVLHHLGIMDRGQESLSIRVVPDSGTGELTGITGSFAIDRSGGGHRYTFDYSSGT